MVRDSTNRLDRMVKYALKLGHKVMAITEHDILSNAVKIEKVMKDYPDLKIIRGNECYLCRDGLTKETYSKEQGDKFYHFILLAKDKIGHQQIRELSTRAWMRSWHVGRVTRVPTYYQDLIDIVGAAPGHVIGMTACLGGMLGTKLSEYRKSADETLYTKIKKWLIQMQGIFGKENFFLEMQPSRDIDQLFVNKEILKLSKELNIEYTITLDAHYLNKAEAPIHKAFLNSQEGEREVDAFYATTYFMDTEELEGYMNDYMTEEDFQSAYNTIEKIADMCEDYSIKRPLKIPSLKWRKPVPQAHQWATELCSKIEYFKTFLESDFIGDRIMVELIAQKIHNDPTLQTEEAYQELNGNLESTWISSEVNQAHWSAYFLNLQYIIDLCWQAGTLVGPGRGSGVGFLALYALDIIQINKLCESTELFPWRFLNPDRVSVLDIDSDIEGGRRAQVLSKFREEYGDDRVANVVTFGTETSKSAIQTGARGLGIDNDTALYISSLIPADRGKIRTLSQCYYGDEENGFAPIPLFVQQMNLYPDLWETAKNIEGIVSRAGVHAGGVIFVDEPFTNSTALMKAPSGEIVTQFDLHDSEDCSLIKIDVLSVEALDKMHACLDLLVEYGYIKPEATLRETYEKYLGVYTLEREDSKMWQLVHQHKIESLFQMEKASGIQGIEIVKPNSIDELATLNSVIRLMSQEKGGEQPVETWARYRKDPKAWPTEMRDYGLSEGEIAWLSNYPTLTDGMCESQEGLMSLLQEDRLGGNSLGFADKCRKAIAKKVGGLFDECEKEYYKNATDKGCSFNLVNYVWQVLFRVQRGYSFCKAHTLAYSMVALQEMNLAYKYPIIFWNTACLITDSGGAEQEEEETPDDKKKARSNNYGKIATAIGKMAQNGVIVEPPNINTSNYTFTPDVSANKITYGLSGIMNTGEEVINTIIANRPYVSVKDFYNRVKPKKQSMVSLIKGGAFDSMMDRKKCMAWYIWETCDKKKNITLQNMPGLIKYNVIPEEHRFEMPKRVYEFNRYLKSMCKYKDKDYYKLDERAMNFLSTIEKDILIIQVGEDQLLHIKKWEKVYSDYMDIFRDWFKQDKPQILTQLNDTIFLEDWNKYGQGTLSSWEMDALGFYYHQHELLKVDKSRYGLSDFMSLSEEPIVERSFVKGDKTINLFKLNKIAGTCIAKDKLKSTVTLLTTDGVVTVKMRKELFSYYDQQVSRRMPDGTKQILERSWFNRGMKIIVQGVRSGDNFLPKKYASTPGHTIYRIEDIRNNGELDLRTERIQGDMEDEV